MFGFDLFVEVRRNGELFGDSGYKLTFMKTALGFESMRNRLVVGVQRNPSQWIYQVSIYMSTLWGTLNQNIKKYITGDRYTDLNKFRKLRLTLKRSSGNFTNDVHVNSLLYEFMAGSLSGDS